MEDLHALPLLQPLRPQEEVSYFQGHQRHTLLLRMTPISGWEQVILPLNGGSICKQVEHLFHVSFQSDHFQRKVLQFLLRERMHRKHSISGGPLQIQLKLGKTIRIAGFTLRLADQEPAFVSLKTERRLEQHYQTLQTFLILQMFFALEMNQRRVALLPSKDI